MSWLGKMFKKKKKGYNTDSKYKLLIIDDEADLLHKNLGICDVRVKELLAIAVEAYDRNKTLHKGLEEVVSQCTHTNEVVMITLMLQKIVDQNAHADRLHNMLKNMLGRG